MTLPCESVPTDSANDIDRPCGDRGPRTETAKPIRTAPVAASAQSLLVEGDVHGFLHGMNEHGHALWSHAVGGAIQAIDVMPDGRTIVAGCQGGYLVVLRKGAGPDPYAAGSSRFSEAWRVIIWPDEAAPLRW